MKSYKVLDRFHISGRGDAVAVTADDDPPKTGETVLLDGVPRIVIGVEVHPTMGGIWTGGLIARGVGEEIKKAIEEARKLDASATPAPWIGWTSQIDEDITHCVGVEAGGRDKMIGAFEHLSDQRFAIYARSLLPRLAGLLEAEHAKLVEAESDYQAILKALEFPEGQGHDGEHEEPIDWATRTSQDLVSATDEVIKLRLEVERLTELLEAENRGTKDEQRRLNGEIARLASDLEIEKDMRLNDTARATEMHRRAQQAESMAQAEAGNWESLHAKLLNAWTAAKNWTEDNKLCADWPSVAGSPFWMMTSENNRNALAVLVGQRDEAESNYAFMVKRAVDQRLDGYRELGAKCAALEAERDEAQADTLRVALLLAGSVEDCDHLTAKLERTKRLIGTCPAADCWECDPKPCPECATHDDPAACQTCDGSSKLHQEDCPVRVPDDDLEDPLATLDRLLGDAEFKFWICPDGCSHIPFGEKARVTVTWEGNVATCTVCGKTNQEVTRGLVPTPADMTEPPAGDAGGGPCPPQQEDCDSCEKFAACESEELLYGQALATVTEAGRATPSLLQRRLQIGFHVATRLLDRMEKDGIVGPADGARPRELLTAGPPSLLDNGESLLTKEDIEEALAPFNGPPPGGYNPGGTP